MKAFLEFYYISYQGCHTQLYNSECIIYMDDIEMAIKAISQALFRVQVGDTNIIIFLKFSSTPDLHSVLF